MIFSRFHIVSFLAFAISFASCTKEPVSSTDDKIHLKYNKQDLVSELQKLDLSKYDAAFRAVVENGTYQPIFSIENTFTVDDLTRIDQGMGNYFSSEQLRLCTILDEAYSMNVKDTIPAQQLVEKELALRQAATKYHQAINFGIVDPRKIYEIGFYAPAKQADSTWLAQQYTDTNYMTTLQAAQPQNTNYAPLRSAYIQFKNTPDTTWQELPKLPQRKIELGDNYAGTPILRQRFGLPQVEDTLPDYLKIDSVLVDKIKEFQSSYGLNADGVIGNSTLGILNTSPDELQKKVEATLERFRWNYDLQYDSLLLANIAEYKLLVYENGKVIQDHKVCVGLPSKDYKTPEFIDTLERIVVNPKWYVPRSIATKEILVDQIEDSTYITRNQYAVYQQGIEVDPSTIDWTMYSEDNLPFRFVQNSGGGNALGRVKFLFPNKYSIYFHDTPSKRFFKKDNRAVSHGCVRLDEPFKLADYILGENKTYLEAKEGEETVGLKSPKKYTVFITYYTSWATEDGNIQFRNDIYKKDEVLIEALETVTNQ